MHFIAKADKDTAVWNPVALVGAGDVVRGLAVGAFEERTARRVAARFDGVDLPGADAIDQPVAVDVDEAVEHAARGDVVADQVAVDEPRLTGVGAPDDGVGGLVNATRSVIALAEQVDLVLGELRRLLALPHGEAQEGAAVGDVMTDIAAIHVPGRVYTPGIRTTRSGTLGACGGGTHVASSPASMASTCSGLTPSISGLPSAIRHP